MSQPGPARFPVIVGPTAGGKTGLAIELALTLGGGTREGCPCHWERGDTGKMPVPLGMGEHGQGARATGEGGEVISADAFQVYRGLDIGTAKPTTEERRGVVHHLIDVVEPTESFGVSRWLELAEETIGEIRGRGRVPVVVGGTHLYVKVLLDGLFEGPASDPALREALRAMDPADRRAELERVDPAAAARIHPNDVRRTVRALEVFRQTGTPISEHQRQWDTGRGRSDAVLIGLDWPAEAINRRINARVRLMMERGLLEEVRRLHESGRLGPQAGQALGYKQLVRYLEGGRGGGGSLEEAVEQIKIETRRYAKNQRTWLRRLRATPGSVWIDASVTPPEEWAQVVLRQCFSTELMQ